MKKCIYEILKSKVFRGILFSASVPVLLILFLGGILFAKRFSDLMFQEENRILNYKMDAIAEDMNRQINSMSEVALRLVHYEELLSSYCLDNKINEIEALEIINRFNNFSGLTSNVFVKYSLSERIFTSNTTVSEQFFFENKCGFEDSSSILALLNSVQLESFPTVYIYQENGLTLFLFPRQLFDRYDKERMVIGFVISDYEVKKIITEVAGNIYGNMGVYYGDYCLYVQNADGLSDESDFQNTQEDDRFSAEYSLIVAQSGNIRVTLDTNVGDYYSLRNAFTYDEIIMGAAVLLVLFFVILLMAWWNYLPFHRMSVKYYSNQQVDKIRDWKDIDSMLGRLAEEKLLNSELLKFQFQMLRELVVYLIITTDYSDKMYKYLTLLNIRDDFSVFGVVTAEIQRNQNVEKYDSKLCLDINGLSNESCNLNSCWLNDGCLAILVGTEECYYLDDVEDLLLELFQTIAVKADVKLKGKSDDLKTLHQAYEKDRNRESDDAKDKLSENKCDFATDIKTEKNKRIMKRVLEYIDAHYNDYNLSLGLIASELHLTVPYLSTIIKKELGMSYKEYLINFRIEKAKVLLAEETSSVTDICQKVGYVKVSYFIKIFQEHAGMTPSMYREHCVNGK